MQVIIETYKNTGSLYHGYCIEGERGAVFNRLCAFLEEDLEFTVRGNTDFWAEDFDSFGIDESRTLKEIHANKSFRTDSKKIYVIKTNSITREAQNALLKVFEEPGEGNHFFIITPTAEMLLPTLKSRLLIIKSEQGQAPPYAVLAKNFLKKGLAQRLALVKEMVEEISEEKKTRTDAAAFVQAVLMEIKTQKPANEWSTKDAAVLSDVMECADYITDRSSSVKMILEHIALTV